MCIGIQNMKFSLYQHIKQKWMWNISRHMIILQSLLVSALAVMSATEFCDNAGISNLLEKLLLQVFCTL